MVEFIYKCEMCDGDSSKKGKYRYTRNGFFYCSPCTEAYVASLPPMTESFMHAELNE